MGDNTSPPALTPGLMICRPFLQSDTPDNRDVFKRWSIMHFRDLLDLPAPSPASQGITRAFRYTNSAGGLFYTFHTDDVKIWASDAYKNRSPRHDLEHTRALAQGEEAVLKGERAFEGKEEPMVWDICNAEFAILSAFPSSLDERYAKSYHDIPLALLSPKGTRPTAPPCSLVTLTYTSAEQREKPSKQLTTMTVAVIGYISSVFRDYANAKVYATVYRHLADQQPDMHPAISEGKHGDGSWVVCVFMHAEVSDEVQGSLQARVEQVVESTKRDGDWGVQVGVWRGEVFMS
ncbi:hypothetical protein E8E12_011117 [Didymella heteroderae]|uniref:Uncharacterized protein n=1 Tax=Didymella heteroderae TaxID=1769908 RepID=A0A9P5C5J1_9PLEO|nr:hypothetical protein E8E12_011117 [Didymella heteroderae]